MRITFYYLIILFTSIVSAENISAQKKDTIKYNIFDSLENHFLQDIQKHSPETPIGICIDPICIECKSTFAGNRHSENLYKLALAYKSESDSVKYDMEMDIFSKSNRYMLIGGNLYPVYLMWVDDVFFEYLPKNDSCSYGILYHPIGFHHFVYVDMALKVFR